MLLMLRFNVLICILNELGITNAFHTYFPIYVPLSLREKVIAYPDDCRAVRKAYRNIAQQVEQLAYVQRVGGSSPSVPIT